MKKNKFLKNLDVLIPFRFMYYNSSTYKQVIPFIKKDLNLAYTALLTAFLAIFTSESIQHKTVDYRKWPETLTQKEIVWYSEMYNLVERVSQAGEDIQDIQLNKLSTYANQRKLEGYARAVFHLQMHGYKANNKKKETIEKKVDSLQNIYGVLELNMQYTIQRHKWYDRR